MLSSPAPLFKREFPIPKDLKDFAEAMESAALALFRNPEHRENNGPIIEHLDHYAAYAERLAANYDLPPESLSVLIRHMPFEVNQNSDHLAERVRQEIAKWINAIDSAITKLRSEVPGFETETLDQCKKKLNTIFQIWSNPSTNPFFAHSGELNDLPLPPRQSLIR